MLLCFSPDSFQSVTERPPFQPLQEKGHPCAGHLLRYLALNPYPLLKAFGPRKRIPECTHCLGQVCFRWTQHTTTQAAGAPLTSSPGYYQGRVEMPAPPTQRFRLLFFGHSETSPTHVPAPPTVASQGVGSIHHMAHLSVSAHHKRTCQQSSGYCASQAHDCRKALKRRGITPRMARRGIDSSERLGRCRWVMERTHWRSSAAVAGRRCAMSGGHP